MSIIISSTTSEDKDLVWEKDEKGNHTITLYQLPKKGDGEPKKIKSMSIKNGQNEKETFNEGKKSSY